MAFTWCDVPELFFPLAVGPLPGRGGDLAADLEALRRAGFGQLICLIEPHELDYLPEEPTLGAYERQVRAAGMRFVHAPIVDYEAPDTGQIDAIADAVDDRTPTYLHCLAGLGRSGTVAAALLVRNGSEVGEAIQLVRRARPGAIQSAAQEAFLYGLSGPDAP